MSRDFSSGLRGPPPIAGGLAGGPPGFGGGPFRGPPPGPPPGFNAANPSNPINDPMNNMNNGTIRPNSNGIRSTMFTSGPPGVGGGGAGVNNTSPSVSSGAPGVPAVTSASMGPPPRAEEKPLWTPHTTPAGKTYYYNNITKQSSWDKPEEMMTAEEKLLAQSVWKEFKAENKKTYYYNKVTKESVWNEPTELIELKRKAKASLATNGTEEGPPGIENVNATDSKPVDVKPTTPAPGFIHPSRAHLFGGSMSPAMHASPVVPSPVKAQIKLEPAVKLSAPSYAAVQPEMDTPSVTTTEPKVEPQPTPKPEVIIPTPNADGFLYNTKEEAKNALKGLFAEYNIGSTGHSFDQASKLVQHDVRWGALKTLSEKKQCYNEYRLQRAKEEKEEDIQAERDARDSLRRTIEEHPDIKPYMKWRQVEDLLQESKGFNRLSMRAAMDIFESIQRDRLTEEKNVKKESLRAFTKKYREVLESQPLTVITTWEMARELVDRELETRKTLGLDEKDADSESNVDQNLDEEALAEKEKHRIIREDAEQLLELLQIPEYRIAAIRQFELGILEREKEAEAERRRARELRKRKERRAREAYVLLLKELHATGSIHALSTWKESLILIGPQPAFNAMLDTSGVTAIEIFKLYIVDLYEKLTTDMSTIGMILKGISFEMRGNTSLDEFKQILAGDARAQVITPVNIELTYQKLIEKALVRESEERKEAEKELKRKMRSFAKDLRSLDPLIALTDTWDTIRPRVEGMFHFKNIDLDSHREDVFNEVLTELKSNPAKHEREEGEASSGDEGEYTVSSKDKSSHGRSRKSTKSKYESSSKSKSKSKSSRRSRSRSRNSRSRSRSRTRSVSRSVSRSRSRSRSRGRRTYSSDEEEEKSGRHRHSSRRHKSSHDDRKSKRSRRYSSDEDEDRPKESSRSKKAKKRSRRD
ncbi:hypothetical protein, variant [Sphaeroforma arctica JP610]|uniref:WW domain-containing protein n=1 Tax=Sphaeroforma arctica JP610 TaxID=667725 RepID=A0A0L0G082_9EUKA|nr:hypothetical protein, variant [Sphaeroforma arctica JP610]KNC82241.1 hypothetical protein, variant [Sphaeroforma arctica JP610]|eukprot:XP_014156143.1 hypothetical protein, variant [Sphaeroforma arctica JP610]